jgi:hypothetical protein
MKAKGLSRVIFHKPVIFFIDFQEACGVAGD